MRIRVLVVYNETKDWFAFKRKVKKENLPYEYKKVGTVAKAQRLLRRDSFDIVVTDYHLGDGTVYDIIDVARPTPVIVITRGSSKKLALKVMKAGAHDYLIKERNESYLNILPFTIEKACKHMRAREALKESEEKYHAIINNIIDGIITIDEKGIIKSVNLVTEKFFGYTSKEMIGNSVNMLIPSPYSEAHDSYIANYLKTAKPKIIGINRECIGKRKDGSVFPLYLAVSDFRLNGKKMFTGILRDLTVRKQFEDHIHSNGIIDSKGMLASSMAHDFNNVLLGISGNLQMLEMDSWCMNGSQKRFLTNAKKACERAAELVKQYQTLSSVNDYQLSSVDLFEITNEVFNLVTSGKSFRNHRIKNIIELCPGDFYVKANPNALHRVLLNLAKNAVTAIERKKRKGDDFIRVTARYEHDHVCIDFEDSGTGMSEEVKSKAFDPLFTTGDNIRGGQGLGLAVVNKIITKDFNGHIDVESSEGKGTTFHILIPRAPEEPAIADDEQENMRGGNEVVLIVDDEDTIREIMKEILERSGYTIVTARNGIQGVEQYKLHKPDIAVLDLTMPQMSGRDALNEIMTIDSNAKVVLSSGSASDAWKETILGKAKGFLKKPYNPKQLLNTIRNVLDAEKIYET